MKNSLRFLLSVVLLLMAVAERSAAQKKAPQNTLQPPPAGIVVDGNLKEWGDSLHFYNEACKISYSLANGKDTLYIATKIYDHIQQVKIISSGLTISIDTKGRKKETYSITFPVGKQSDSQPGERNPDNGAMTQQDVDDLVNVNLTKLREIRVSGFAEVESDVITTRNTYGFKVAMDSDGKGALTYELAIPLKFFNADDIAKGEWAFNFKINGLSKPGKNPGSDDQDGQGSQTGRGGRGGGRGGRSGGGGRGGQRNVANNDNGGDSDLFKTVDFWDKFFLAK